MSEQAERIEELLALWDREVGALPELLEERSALRRSAWEEKRRGSIAQQTDRQKQLEELMGSVLSAGEARPVFRDVLEAAWAIEERALGVLRQRNRLGADHQALVEVMALSMASMLLEPKEALEIAKVAPPGMFLYLDTGVNRIVWPPDVGVCKTVMACSTGKEINTQLLLDPYLRHPMSRGLLYAASNTRLLADFRDALIGMGVQGDRIGILYSKGTECRYPSIARSQTSDYPLLLVTQSMLMGCTAREQRREPVLRGQLTISDLLVYRNRDRLCIWDEAFESAIAEAASRFQLTMAKGALSEPMSRQQLIRKAKEQKRQLSAEPLEELAGALAVLIDDINNVVAVAEGEKPCTTRVERVVIPSAIGEHADQLATAGKVLEDMNNSGMAAALDSLSEMAKLGGIQVSVLGSGPPPEDGKDGRRDRIHVVTPRIVISDRITRLVVLDANYQASRLAQMDPTLRLATGAETCGRVLQPKRYEDLSIHWYADPSGRRHGENEGLDNKRVRRRVIRDQVERAACVPPTERCLFVTFCTNKGGPDFQAEIAAELDKCIPTWRDPVLDVSGELRQRIEFLTWGAHVGVNDYADVGHVFVVGVMRRGWVTRDAKASLRSTVFAAGRGEPGALDEVNPSELITDQAASALVQALGRGRMRLTDDGRCGQMTAHIPYKEVAGIFLGKAPCSGSPLWKEMERRLPGVRMQSSSEPPPLSGMEIVASAARQVLEALPPDVEVISSAKLRPLVDPLLPDGGKNISSKVFLNGLGLMNKENAERLAQGAVASAWVKPEPTARSWIRGGAQPCPSNAPIPGGIQ
jgi:hypothetical protein